MRLVFFFSENQPQNVHDESQWYYERSALLPAKHSQSDILLHVYSNRVRFHGNSKQNVTHVFGQSV